MKIRYLYFFFLVVSLNTLTAQIPQHQIDSIINSLPTLNEENKMLALNNLAWEISYNDFNLGLDYAFKSIELAKKINHVKGLSKAYNTVGTIYADLGMYNEALKYYNLTIEINKENNLKDGLASVYANIAIFKRC
jgi:tetratricopeptide (TPR) repeat protein